MKLSREEEILLAVESHTKEAILAGNYTDIGQDALALSVDLMVDRSNVSRILNTLWNNGFLSKIQGKPTFYFSKKIIEQFFPKIFIPSTLEAGVDLKKFLLEHADASVNEKATVNLQQKTTYLGYSSTDGSMYQIAQRLASQFFPLPITNHFFIIGEKGTGKKKLANYIFDIGKRNNSFFKQEKPVFINPEKLCLSEKEYSQLFLGDATGNSKRKGLFTKNEYGLLVVEQADKLPNTVMRMLQNVCESGSFYEFNQPNKERPLKTILLFLKESSSEKDQLDPSSGQLPTLQEKPLSEKIQFCIYFLEQAADKIEQSVRIHKDILSCFITSKYENNLLQMKQEIFYAVSNARAKARLTDQMIAEVSFDELSDNVLNRINVTNPLVGELNLYLSFWQTDFLYFVPKTQDNSELIQTQLTALQSQNTITKKSLLIMEECKNIYNQHLHLSKEERFNLAEQPIFSILMKQYGKKISDKEENGLLAFTAYLLRYFEEKQHSFYHQMNYIKIPVEANRFFTKANELKKQLKRQLNIILTNQEFDLIACYFLYLNQLAKNDQLPIIILSHGENIGATYIKYIDTLNLPPVELYALDYVSEKVQEFGNFLKDLEKLVQTVSNGNGVLIVSDIEPLTNIHSAIESELQIPCQTFSPVSLPLLLKIIKKMQNQGYTIADFKKENKHKLKKIEQSYDNELIDKLADSLLNDSLVFLNPHKTAKILFTILNDILTELQLENSEEITVRFVVHCSFMLERVIKKEAMNFPKLREFVNTNSKLFHAIESQLSKLNNIFDMMIPSGENAFVCEIFKDMYGI